MLPLVSVAASLWAYFFLVTHETLFEFLFFIFHFFGPAEGGGIPGQKLDAVLPGP